MLLALVTGTVFVPFKKSMAVSKKNPITIRKKVELELGQVKDIIPKVYSKVSEGKEETCDCIANVRIKILKKTGTDKVKIKKKRDGQFEYMVASSIKPGTAKIKVKISGRFVHEYDYDFDHGFKKKIYGKKVSVTKTIKIKVKKCPVPKPDRTSITIKNFYDDEYHDDAYGFIYFRCGDQVRNIKKVKAESEDPTIVKAEGGKKRCYLTGYKDGSVKVKVTVLTYYPINGKTEFVYTIDVKVKFID